MTSPQGYVKDLANAKTTSFLPGDVSSATDVGWVDMKNYNGFRADVLLHTLAGTGITAFLIIANEQSDGGGTDVIIKTHAAPTTANAAGDRLVMECSADEIRQEGVQNNPPTARYVSVKVTANNSGDLTAVTYRQYGPKVATLALDGDQISA